MTDTQLFIEKLKLKCNKKISFIDEVSSVLDINYDAAYRRITLKTKLDFNEVVKLSKYFKVPLNDFVNDTKENYFFAKKTIEVKSLKDLESYFISLNKTFLPFQNRSQNKIFYSAKDLPIFYLFNNPILLKFKIYVWLYILEPNLTDRRMSYKDFEVPQNLIKIMSETGEIYNNLIITELWGYEILESIINQINFFYDLKLLDFHSAIKICDNLKLIVDEVELAAKNGYRNNLNKTPFNLYSNDLLLLNNNVYFKGFMKRTLFSPYSLLSYYLIEDQEVCLEYEELLKNQLDNSKLLSNTGLKDRILFFKPKYQKIKDLEKKILFYRDFPLNNF
jgi:hypothetical protein